MDDTVVSLLLPPIENKSVPLEANIGHIITVRSLLTDKMKKMFGLQIDVTRSLIGREKLFYLNVLT
eukprot:458898-Amphidinium_carterae.1